MRNLILISTGIALVAISATLKNRDEAKLQERRIFSKRLYSSRSTVREQKTPSTGLDNIKPLSPVLIAVVDTGVDILHPALKDSIWTNPGESGKDSLGRDKSSNGIDDDRNGFVDDLHGWNFADNDPDISDHHGHGTHISGIIAARKTKSYTFVGVSPNAKIMVLKYFGTSQSGQGQVKATIDAFAYAIKMGAKIINYSAGGSTANPTEYSIIDQARQKGILLISAAGNQGLDADLYPYYPASYDLENVLSVGGLAPNDELFEASNFGKNNIDITAPGENIYSTLPGENYGLMSGTSQATAFLTGYAAVIMGMPSPPGTIAELKSRLIKSGQPLPSLKNKIGSSNKALLRAAMHSRGRFQTEPLPRKYRQAWDSLAMKFRPKPTKGPLNRAPSMQSPDSE